MRQHESETRRTPRWKWAAVFVVVVLTAAACSSGEAGQADDRPFIVVTTSVWSDVVANIVGDDATVELIIPIGANAHDFAPSSQQVASIQTADLVIANGLGLEEMLEDVLGAAEVDGVTVLDVAPLVDPIPFALTSGHDRADEEGDHADEDSEHADEEGEHAGEGDEHGHGHDGDDPHVWMDPDRVALGALAIADALTALDGSVDWLARAEAYADEVRAAGERADEILAVVAQQQRQLVTNHEALGYFADRFAFEVVGVVFPGGSTLSDPSSAELAELVEVMEEEGVRVIFGESSSPSTLAEAVAAEVGEDVHVVELFTGSLGEPGSGAESVVGMVITNAERIAETLGG